MLVCSVILWKTQNQQFFSVHRAFVVGTIMVLVLLLEGMYKAHLALSASPTAIFRAGSLFHWRHDLLPKTRRYIPMFVFSSDGSKILRYGKIVVVMSERWWAI
jgi:hypothetical protein